MLVIYVLVYTVLLCCFVDVYLFLLFDLYYCKDYWHRVTTQLEMMMMMMMIIIIIIIVMVIKTIT